MSEFLCADCMEHLPNFPNGYFDLAIVDPPYGGGSSVDARDTCHGAIVGRFGGQFARYFDNQSGGRFDAYRKRQVFKDGRNVGDEIPDERGFV